jgi:ribosomal protein S18 acetylase RimI-like enzyme
MRQEVRRVRAGEWRQYRELRLEALKDSPLAFVEQYEDALARADQFWRDRVDRGAAGQTSSTFVAVRAGRFVAEAVMGAVLRWAREEVHADRIRLFVMESNTLAGAFYRRIGFVPTGVEVAYPPNPAFSEHELEYRVVR